MPRPKYILRETHRECRRCREMLPLDSDHFDRAPSGRGGWSARCTPCLRIGKRESREARREAMFKARPLKPGQICDVCFGLAHRVEGDSCMRCGLQHQPEAPIKPVLRKFDWAV